MTEIKFRGDLPPTDAGRHSRGKHDRYFDALRRRPGEWADFPKQGTPSANKSAAGNIRLGMFRNTEKGEFEATNYEGVLYARYVGSRS